ncbi:uncharacterized protein PG986_009702 [Apiospora aurea]|uniref:Uncharacterized protein n=1 Tax=Apiospora aurea TaxID=335848 RepID=A0ABR1Q8E9_9PEZI
MEPVELNEELAQLLGQYARLLSNGKGPLVREFAERYGEFELPEDDGGTMRLFMFSNNPSILRAEVDHEPAVYQHTLEEVTRFELRTKQPVHGESKTWIGLQDMSVFYQLVAVVRGRVDGDEKTRFRLWDRQGRLVQPELPNPYAGRPEDEWQVFDKAGKYYLFYVLDQVTDKAVQLETYKAPTQEESLLQQRTNDLIRRTHASLEKMVEDTL